MQSLVNERTRQRAVSIRYVHPEESWWVAMMTFLKLSWWVSPVIPTVEVKGTYLSLQSHYSRTGVLLLPNTAEHCCFLCLHTNALICDTLVILIPAKLPTLFVHIVVSAGAKLFFPDCPFAPPRCDA